MNARTVSSFLFATVVFLIWTQDVKSQDDVIIVGAMKNVMWHGKLEGNIELDTIQSKDHLYGLGPVEYLQGELMILDGVCYVSKVITESEMSVIQTFDVKAPFFGYANVESWIEIDVPAGIRSISQLETYVDEMTTTSKRPFFFTLSGKANTATIHVVNLPEGTSVSSPDEAHEGLTKYYLEDAEFDILGFFSTEHQTILTHHDTKLHLHLITGDRTMMGHLDEIELAPDGLKLFLPAD